MSGHELLLHGGYVPGEGFSPPSYGNSGVWVMPQLLRILLLSSGHRAGLRGQLLPWEALWSFGQG